MRIQEKIYFPPKYLTFICLTGFLFTSLLIFMIRKISLLTIGLFLFGIMSILAMIDLHSSRVIFKDSYIEIKNLLKKERINISEMKKVTIQDHELWIYLKNEKTKRMPGWFGDRHSLYKLLDNKIKNC